MRILKHLLDSDPARLDELPTGRGIYAPYDHARKPRYIGITGNLIDRIFKRHVGGDGNSHKFSTIFNAGRMFHNRKIEGSNKIDGSIAKGLRRVFAREYCSAVAIPLPQLVDNQLRELEAEVIGLAPHEAILWNGSRVLEAIEPESRVNELLAKLSWPAEHLQAIERQAAVWRALK